MNRGLFVALSALSLMALSGPDERQITDPKSISSVSNPGAGPVSIDDLFFTRNVGGPSWSPDGKDIVLTTNLTGRNNLWKVSSSGGWPIQVSQSDDRQSGAVWSPDRKWILYQQDRGGGEIYDIFAIPSAGGEAVNLTHTDDISETAPQFSPDGKTVAISWKPKKSPVPDIALLDWNTHNVRNLTNERAKDHLWEFVAWSPDANSIYADRAYIGGTDSDVYRIDVKTGGLENLTPHQGNTVYAASSLSSDGRTLLINSNKTGFNNVALLDITSKKITPVTDTQWDAAAGNFAPSGSSFTYLINQDGQTEIYLGDRESGRHERLPFPQGLTYFSGNPSPWSPNGDRLLIGHQSSQQASDLWIYDLRVKQPVQLTYSAIADLIPSRLPGAQVVHYKSFDGKMISAFVWIPFNLERNGTAPGVVLPHGGPTGQTVDYFNRDAAALASRGYVCIAPNVRGSTGYGIAFQEANKKDLGGGDLQDEVYAAHFLVDTGYVDKRKIGITGGSYGGYMTLMAIGKTPDIWAAAVEEYGIINWLTMLQHEDPLLQQYEQSLLGDPVKDRKVYEADSPITFIRNEKAPLLVLQGDNDIRVPKEEAEQVVSILKQEGRTVDAHYYPNEGHGFSKRENEIDAMRRTIDWFDRYLKGNAAHSTQ
ncbi:MAG TPA: S9 family peptidase [Bryobacteraceae bacterium]|nr:S9 family peptidase [Bryobacteraceae bacterium]